MRIIYAIAVALAIFTAVPAHAAQKIVVALEWYVNPDHGPLIIAEQQGYFAEAGLEVELIAPANPTDPPKLAAAGEADIALYYQPQLHLLVESGLPIVRVGTLIATPLNCIVVREDSEIFGIGDLEGKKIGFSVAGFEDILLEAALENYSVPPSSIEMINVNFSLSPSLMSGQVDAVIGAYRNFELHQMDLNNVPGRAFYLEEIGIPAYDELIYIVNTDSVQRPEIRKFIDATERAVQFIVNHPDRGWQDFVEYDPKLDNELNRRAWYDTIPRFALRPGALDAARYDAFAAFLHERGLLGQIAPVGNYAVELPSAH